ncbi:hypothetical protein B7494_g4065 [Chlorociboria aeruginascens]|nr:hypothetical protein B7494_g4065 [Chlorociboria aeruginascens]
MATPTLIGMPEPPSAPETPTEAPGTPNSTTTSLSALSTTAIKDGHRGTAPLHGSGHHHHHSSNTLEAERADRISRLAGLERVSTARVQGLTPGSGISGNPSPGGQIPGYFDQAGNPVYTTRMSTVGSASATGSIGGRTTTWASGSAKGQTEADDDEMSMDTNDREMDDRDHYSASAMDEDMDGDGMSDDTSLVGFGEGAGSTVSGPISRNNLSPAVGNRGFTGHLQGGATPATPVSASTTATADQQRREARMIDGLADDTSGYVDTAARGGVGVPVSRSTGVEAAEKIVRDRLDGGEGKRPPLGSPDDAGLGKFYFEEKK